MRRILQLLAVSSLFLAVQTSARAQETLVPAGTLLHCTLDEPNLSSATADVGDPVICHLSALRQFGHSVFPRGAYLGGHLEAEKEPGHFVGKGYLKIEFDRIGFPDSDIPVPAKIIAAKGYKVDKKGDIVGKGHPRRDVIEWMIPPLWPWKVLTLPAKGPRPTLKGEEQVTVRLMDDIDVPQLIASSRYSRPPAPAAYHSQGYRTQGYRKPTAMERSSAPAQASSAVSEISFAAPELAPLPVVREDAMATSVAPAAAEDGGVTATAVAMEVQQASPAMSVTPVRVRLIALKSEKVYAVTSYHINGGSVSYALANGGKGSLDITAVDWRATSRLNAEQGNSTDRVDSRTY